MMNYHDVVYMTEAGFDDLQQELNLLKCVKRAEVAEKLAITVSEGELDQNATYEAAKLEQAMLEGRISDLEDALRHAEIVTYDGPIDAVRVGCTVTIAEEGWDEAEQYKIVGMHQAKPGEGLISDRSPIGSALLGAKVGDTIVALTPAGETRLEVLGIV